MRAIPALAAVEAPAIIDRADTEPAPPGAALRFRIGYSLARVLRYFSAPRKVRL